MPSGHTTKQTMTPYRASLMRLIGRKFGMAYGELDHAARKQANDMLCYGWLENDNGVYRTTLAGREKLHEYEVAL